MMKTGYEDTKTALEFGLPYVILHTPRPFDTTTLNYNWQIWGVKAFSLYTTTTETIDPSSSKQAVDAILNFLSKERIIRFYRKRRIYFQNNPVKGHNLTEKQEGRILGITETGRRVRRKGRAHSKNPGHLLRPCII